MKSWGMQDFKVPYPLPEKVSLNFKNLISLYRDEGVHYRAIYIHVALSYIVSDEKIPCLIQNLRFFTIRLSFRLR